MWRLKELEIIELFRKPGGADFAEFCDEVIRATCWAQGVPQSEIFMTARTDAKDGGVDERVARPVNGDSSGYFETKSIWQFKASDEANVTSGDMPKETNKSYARSCIESGHAYRICVCDHLTPEKRDSLEKSLTAAVLKINPSAPEPKVLGVKEITELANTFPALVLQYRPGLAGVCILFGQWEQMMTRVTRNFVPGGGFEPMKATILDYTDFAKQPAEVVLALHGQSGVGKSRTVFESLRSRSGSQTMVIYLNDEEQAKTLANFLVNDQKAHAVLVADECSLATRVKLSATLSSCKGRIRCICIDNSTQRPGSAAPELIVTKPSYVELQKILADNFPQIALDRIRAYAHLSEGFIRVAADMCCYYDETIAQVGHFGPIAEKLEEYYQDRLQTKERMQAVEAVALLKRVKRKGESPTELDMICQLTGLDRKEVEQNLGEIKDAPGFVERGELYYRVTPELIAIIAFEAAWRRWAERDPDAFLRSIPEQIQESFLERVSEGRSAEVRKIVHTFFRRFADSFTSRDLADLHLVSRFIKLIETDPVTYLPVLRQVVESANPDELGVGSRFSRDPWTGSWGPRRQLVWLAEQFVQFREYFSDCERILYVLAVHECEPDLGNNATHIWQQLFKMQLSGTAMPIENRLTILQSRLDSASEESIELLVGAVGSILDFQGGRLVGPPVVAGRMVPPEWRPERKDIRDHVIAALKFIEDASRHRVLSLAQKAKEVFLHDIEWLTRQGWLDELRPIVAQSPLTEDDRAVLVSRLKQFLAWAKTPDGRKVDEDYAKKMESWIKELQPHSLHSRLVEVVGSRQWDHFGRESEWESSLRQLAEELNSNDNLFDAEFDWLTSPDAISAFNLGYVIGATEKSERFLDKILSRSVNRDTGLARGYVAGLLSRSGVEVDPIGVQLDHWESENPAFAFQLALAGGERVNVFDRTVRLIKSGRLPAYYLRSFTHWVGRNHVSDTQVLIAVRILLPHVDAGEEFCSNTLMDFLGARLHAGELINIINADPELFWKALTAFTAHPGRQEVFWWARCLEFAAPNNPNLAIRLACTAVVGGNFDISNEASNLLSAWAKQYPDQVMSEVGSIMLDEKTGLNFFVSKFPVFQVLPVGTVIDWLKKVGPIGAQRIARHLPTPTLDNKGNPVVPELTAWVLSTFENDERVFAEFCAGVHSFQLYRGDAVAVHETEAAAALKFLSHPLKRIRQWAQVEHESALKYAQLHREWEDAQR